MNRLTGFLRELTPAWMTHPRQQAAGEVIAFRPKSQLRAGDADDLWRDHVEKGLFGADTSDYSGVPEPQRQEEALLPGIDREAPRRH